MCRRLFFPRKKRKKTEKRKKRNTRGGFSFIVAREEKRASEPHATDISACRRGVGAPEIHRRIKTNGRCGLIFASALFFVDEFY